jgi:hypothetical protein
MHRPLVGRSALGLGMDTVARIPKRPAYRYRGGVRAGRGPGADTPDDGTPVRSQRARSGHILFRARRTRRGGLAGKLSSRAAGDRHRTHRRIVGRVSGQVPAKDAVARLSQRPRGRTSAVWLLIVNIVPGLASSRRTYAMPTTFPSAGEKAADVILPASSSP